MATHRVAILAIPGVLPLDLGIPAQVFGPRSATSYRLSMCAIRPGEVPVSSGFSVKVPGDLATLCRADTVIVPGFAPHRRALPDEVLDALASLHGRGRRVVSICTGAFALAAAGILDGRRATTHWCYTAELAERYPQVRVERDVLYVDEGNVLTSAGVSAGIDLCLHIVRRDFGARTANTVARSLVAAPHREGGQAQYLDRSVPDERGSSLTETRMWAQRNLGAPLTLKDLAGHAHVSERTLIRRFVAETGLSALQWILAARVDLARELLETTALTIEQVAEQCGLGTPANLRCHFRRVTGTSPTSYRRAFNADAT